jgi:hypothetical protein
LFWGISNPGCCLSIKKPADKILIEKKARRLTLLRNNAAFKTYRNLFEWLDAPFEGPPQLADATQAKLSLEIAF